MTTPSVSNLPVTTDARRRPLTYPSSRDATVKRSYDDAAPSSAAEPLAWTVEPPAGPSAWTHPVPPERQGTSHNIPDEMAAGAFATGARAFVPERDRFRESMTPFVHQMAQFCSSDAIRLAGNWNARLVLDERILASTTLNLSLSHFDLSLAFETRDPATRQFLTAHLDELEQALRVSLHALGRSKDVFLTIR
ncbi:type III secretion system protein SctP [Burkholderia lata]|uniref:type III secretion system protein SctP n=1 Tax=Burkholderia lata (strain ATCC 17760 / DSM 23089 / LMG 22485 / NCIMB 9086 / R18194 / 383) TaxID=482957 RepID=UPI0015831D35|nr:type III secretion system protein SctP [Burkholderia lata]